MRISVLASKELQGVILALKAMDKDLAKQIRQHTKRMIEPAWKRAVAENVTSPLERRVLHDTARVAVSNQNVTLKSAAIGRTLVGGAKPYELAPHAEFGADRDFRRSYSATSRKGKAYTVRNRRTRAQFRPRNRKGYVVYPAAADVIPRLAALWVQTTVRTFHEAIERR